MNPVTLTLRGHLETSFWESYRSSLVWVDVAAAMKVCVQVVIVDLNIFGLLPWDLVATRPSLVYFYTFMMVVRLSQLFFIGAARQRYWTYRLVVNLFIKVYVAFIITQSIYAGTQRPGFWDVDWLGGSKDVITARSAILRALLLPTGALNAVDDVIMHQLPFRLMLLPQVIVTVLLVHAGWSPITKLLHFHPKLTADAIHWCEVARQGIGIVTGMGSIKEGLPATPCNDPTVLSRAVLTTQLIFIFLLPLWLAYIMESRAKCAFLADHCNMAEADAASAVVLTDWGKRISIVFLVCGIFACKCAVDTVHWLEWHPLP